MSERWTEERLRKVFIEGKVEENTTLEYKRADALGKSNGWKKKLAKEVSAMANAAGGTIIYGIREYDDEEQKHLPEDIDPVDRTEFDRERLDQLIASNTEPSVDVTIEPIDVEGGVVYLVKVPKSTIAHQVTTNRDYRYYERRNTTIDRMPDHRIRDVMNRAKAPLIDVELNAIREKISADGREHIYRLIARLCNRAAVAALYQKLEIAFPNYGEGCVTDKKTKSLYRDPRNPQSITFGSTNEDDYQMIYRSSVPLFPGDTVTLENMMVFKFKVNDTFHRAIMGTKRGESLPRISWTVFADDMAPRSGEVPVKELIQY